MLFQIFSNKQYHENYQNLFHNEIIYEKKI